VEGAPSPIEGKLCDLLFKDARQGKSFVVETPRKGAKEARLTYRVEETLAVSDGTLSRVRIALDTGRSHQIRVQFSTRGFPLVGDHKYGSRDEHTAPLLFSRRITFPYQG
jgi:23S rRNA pseudouridine1911/1915/1917 synthase